MPARPGTRAASVFCDLQSQKGEMFITRLIWKEGFCSRTAFAYSAILQFILFESFILAGVTASFGQGPAHAAGRSRHILPEVCDRGYAVSWAQITTQAPQPVHSHLLLHNKVSAPHLHFSGLEPQPHSRDFSHRRNQPFHVP